MKPGESPPVVSCVGFVEYTSQRLPPVADSPPAPARLMKSRPVPSVTPALPAIDAPEAMVKLPLAACMTTGPAPETEAFTLIAL